MPSYKIIEGNVKIGMNPRFVRDGIWSHNYIFYWETESNIASCRGIDFNIYKKGMRGFFITPSQLLNTGTLKNEISGPFDEEYFRELCKFLVRPYLILSAITQEPTKNISDYPVGCTLVYDNLETPFIESLNKLARVFRESEFNLDDILFNEEQNKRIPEQLRKIIRKKVLDYM